MGFYDFSTGVDVEAEFQKRWIKGEGLNNGGAGGYLTIPAINTLGTYVNFITANTRLFVVGEIDYSSSTPYNYKHYNYPSFQIGSITDLKNNVDDPIGTVKDAVAFRFWNRYRGDGTGWQISYGRSASASVRQQFFCDAANGLHNRSRFVTVGYDQDVYNGQQNTLVWKDHNVLNLWGSGHVSIGEHFNMATDGANNGTAGDLDKPKYHLSIQNGLGVGNSGSFFWAKLHIRATQYDVARSRGLAYFENVDATKGAGFDINANLIFGTAQQYIVFFDQTLGIYKKARINNGSWEISNY